MLIRDRHTNATASAGDPSNIPSPSPNTALVDASSGWCKLVDVTSLSQQKVHFTMPFLSTTRRRLAATASVVAVAGTGAVFALTSGAFASAPKPPPSPKPSTTTTPTTAPASTCTTGAAGRSGLLGHRGLLARTDYATFEIRRKGHFETVVLDRGEVTAVSSTDITIKRPDGVTVTIGLDPTTQYLGVSGESAVQTGHHASVVSASGSALRVSQITKKS